MASDGEFQQALEELAHLLGEIDAGWSARYLTRGAIDKVRLRRVEEVAVTLAETKVNDYFTSRAAELLVEPQVRKIARELAIDFVTELDRWAR